MKKKTIIIPVLLCLIAAGIFIGVSYKEAQAPISTSDIKWLTYKSEKYAFQISYPDTWQVVENTTIPVINIYKKGELAQPPFTIHSTSTAIAIFPKGLGTEGPQSQTRPSTVSFGEITKNPIDYLLKDSTPWGTFAFFKDQSKSKEWNEFAFIWAGVHVDNLAINCVSSKGKSVEGPCEFGVESTESKTIRTGSINSQDRALEEKMLQSFRFIK